MSRPMKEEQGFMNVYELLLEHDFLSHWGFLCNLVPLNAGP